jgi:hypothetical protein
MAIVDWIIVVLFLAALIEIIQWIMTYKKDIRATAFYHDVIKHGSCWC